MFLHHCYNIYRKSKSVLFQTFATQLEINMSFPFSLVWLMGWCEPKLGTHKIMHFFWRQESHNHVYNDVYNHIIIIGSLSVKGSWWTSDCNWWTATNHLLGMKKHALHRWLINWLQTHAEEHHCLEYNQCRIDKTAQMRKINYMIFIFPVHTQWRCKKKKRFHNDYTLRRIITEAENQLLGVFLNLHTWYFSCYSNQVKLQFKFNVLYANT